MKKLSLVKRIGSLFLVLTCLMVFLPSRSLGAATVSVNGSDVANYAKTWVGVTPYKPDGTSLETGTDCSGFICLIYQHFGINIWSNKYDMTQLVSSGQATNLGTDISKAEPGDIIKFSGLVNGKMEGHVALYYGNGYIVHALNPNKGTVYTTVSYVVNSGQAVKAILRLKSVYVTYTIKYDANGGSGAPAPQTKIRDKALTLSTIKPTKTGYDFWGWSNSKNASSPTYLAGGSYTANTAATLYAVWKAHSYTVKFYPNDGSGNYAAQPFTYGQTKALSANAFKRTGYHFKGWATTSGGTVKYADKQNVSNLTSINGATVNLYAVWGINTYSVKFYAVNGTGATDSQNFTYGKTQALKANAFKHTGYTFKGWATTPGGAVKYKDKQNVSNLTSENGKTVSLYAVWEAHTYTVNFHANGGMGIMFDQKFIYGKAQTLKANAYFRVGYTFKGWATTKTGSVKYNDKQSVSNLTSADKGTVNLCAVWKKK